MSAATDRWREITDLRHPARADVDVWDAGDALAALVDRIERVAELELADDPQTGYGAAMRYVLRIVREDRS